jgi:hypothetical protein
VYLANRDAYIWVLPDSGHGGPALDDVGGFSRALNTLRPETRLYATRYGCHFKPPFRPGPRNHSYTSLVYAEQLSTLPPSKESVLDSFAAFVILLPVHHGRE